MAMESRDLLENAALLISCLPAADAEQLLQRMPEETASTIRLRARDSQVPAAQRLAAARRFIREMSQVRSRSIHRRIDAAQPPASFHFLAQLLPSRLADALASELPKTTATVLSVLPASKAADVLTLLPDEYQQQVVHHMLCSGPVSDHVLRDVADSLVDVLSRQCVTGCGGPAGRERLAELLQFTDAATRQRLAEAARRDGVDLAVAEPQLGGC
jgi:flagellar motor switch protein FliG